SSDTSRARAGVGRHHRVDVGQTVGEVAGAQAVVHQAAQEVRSAGGQVAAGLGQQQADVGGAEPHRAVEVRGVVAAHAVVVQPLPPSELVGGEGGGGHERVDVEARVLGQHVGDVTQGDLVGTDGVERPTRHACGDHVGDDAGDQVDRRQRQCRAVPPGQGAELALGDEFEHEVEVAVLAQPARAGVPADDAGA